MQQLVQRGTKGDMGTVMYSLTKTVFNILIFLSIQSSPQGTGILLVFFFYFILTIIKTFP